MLRQLPLGRRGLDAKGRDRVLFTRTCRRRVWRRRLPPAEGVSSGAQYELTEIGDGKAAPLVRLPVGIYGRWLQCLVRLFGGIME